MKKCNWTIENIGSSIGGAFKNLGAGIGWGVESLGWKTGGGIKDILKGTNEGLQEMIYNNPIIWGIALIAILYIMKSK